MNVKSFQNREIPFSLFLIFVYLMLAATALAIIVQWTTQRRERLQAISDRKAEIEEMYRAGKINDYTIKVHALKSSARIIGAVSFGEEAQQLENAGKSGDINYIREHREAFMEEFMAFREPLKYSLDLIKASTGEDK